MLQQKELTYIIYTKKILTYLISGESDYRDGCRLRNFYSEYYLNWKLWSENFASRYLFSFRFFSTYRMWLILSRIFLRIIVIYHWIGALLDLNPATVYVLQERRNVMLNDNYDNIGVFHVKCCQWDSLSVL